jgi:hypothetical protein
MGEILIFFYFIKLHNVTIKQDSKVLLNFIKVLLNGFSLDKYKVSSRFTRILTEMQNSLRTIDKFGKMQSVGRGLTAAITLPILAVGAAFKDGK